MVRVPKITSGAVFFSKKDTMNSVWGVIREYRKSKDGEWGRILAYLSKRYDITFIDYYINH